MTQAELHVLGLGIALLFAFGGIHLAGLEGIRWAKPKRHRHSPLGLLLTFWGLALLHILEIGIAAGAIAWLLGDPAYGMLSDGVNGSDAADLLYFAGISFSTLGYTGMDAHGPIRLMVMMLSLSGFMLITWSATFIYTIWGETFRQ
ncbi:ion channel [Erythrobacter sp.]|uniref:ion channel n=1 Tax=Erythrobacter sp. TaxID=1042 RepID=UPI001425E9AE|nr:ion channel [Erythrobacter sp.]QIQ85581.1 MAG: two pore domain potassium channel family protein [Erythrobacter sp.]